MAGWLTPQKPNTMTLMNGQLFVVVSGPPASGKSTLAPVLADELHLPLIAKDTTKDALMSILPVPDVESRQIGRAAGRAMLELAMQSRPGAVVESNFYRTVARGDLLALPGGVAEIFCRCDAATAARRYRERAGTCHAGHFDSIRTSDELWNGEVSEPVAGGWPPLEVNTNEPVDVPSVITFIRAAS